MISSIVLAAGMSKRMKRFNKLLLKYNDKTILENTILNLATSKIDEIIIVLGYDYENVKKTIKNLPCKIINNINYAKGMSSSILCGIQNINSSAEGVLVCLGDMPIIKTSTYNLLISEFIKKRDPKRIIVPKYKDKRGNPILFGKHYFNSLLNLYGDKGAVDLINNSKNFILSKKINDEGLIRDIDDYKDYELFKKN